jgi:hypothetical protein
MRMLLTTFIREKGMREQVGLELRGLPEFAVLRSVKVALST